MHKFFGFFVLLQLTIYRLVFSQSNVAEILDYATECLVERQALAITYSLKIQVNSKQGLEFADFEIPYEKGDKLTIEVASIEDLNGNTARKLSGNEIQKLNAVQEAFYEDYFIKKFSLRYNIFPYVVDLKYTRVITDYLSICDWTPEPYGQIPVRNARLTVTVPLTNPVRIYQRGISLSECDSDINKVTYKWVGNYENKSSKEIYSHPQQDIIPGVKIVPLKFKYGLEGELSDWDSFGNWVYRLNDGLGDLPESEKTNIDKLVIGQKDDIDKVRSIYHYMQDMTRYINITLDIGGMKPMPASFVASHHYGDCKALTNFLQAALFYVGIKSYYTLIQASGIPVEIIRDFPSQQFNHVILTVPLKEDTIFLENTNTVNPFGYIGTQTQDRYALLIKENDSRLIKTYALKPSDVMTNRYVNITLLTGNSAEAAFYYTLRGYYFELFNELDKYNNVHDQDDFMRDNLNIKNFSVESWNIEKNDRDDRKINLFIKANNQNYIKNYGTFKIIENFGMAIPQFEPPARRYLPVFIPYPVDMRDSTVYHAKDKFECMSVPADTLIKSPYGIYLRRSLINRDSIVISREFFMNSGEYPLSDYESFYQFIANSQKADDEKILIK